MNRPPGRNPLEVQLVAVDHECLFGVVLFAYERALKGHDRSILHRAVLSLDYRPDPDEVNRLRAQQRGLSGVEEAQELWQSLEAGIAVEHGAGRSARELARMELAEVRDCGIRWSVVGKRGAPVRMSPELMGLLERLYPDRYTRTGSPAFLEGIETPRDTRGELVFPPTGFAGVAPYRAPESVVGVYKALSFIDRSSLDAAIDEVVGDGPDAEDVATWLEDDFEALTGRYEHAAARQLGIHYRYG